MNKEVSDFGTHRIWESRPGTFSWTTPGGSVGECPTYEAAESDAEQAAWFEKHEDVKLCDLPDAEFEAGGFITRYTKEAGYDETGKTVVNNNGWWTLTVAEFVDSLS